MADRIVFRWHRRRRNAMITAGDRLIRGRGIVAARGHRVVGTEQGTAA